MREYRGILLDKLSTQSRNASTGEFPLSCKTRPIRLTAESITSLSSSRVWEGRMGSQVGDLAMQNVQESPSSMWHAYTHRKCIVAQVHEFLEERLMMWDRYFLSLSLRRHGNAWTSLFGDAAQVCRWAAFPRTRRAASRLIMCEYTFQNNCIKQVMKGSSKALSTVCRV